MSDQVKHERDEEGGDIIGAVKPDGWESFLEAVRGADLPTNFLVAAERDTGTHNRDPFAEWVE